MCRFSLNDYQEDTAFKYYCTDHYMCKYPLNYAFKVFYLYFRGLFASNSVLRAKKSSNTPIYFRKFDSSTLTFFRPGTAFD